VSDFIGERVGVKPSRALRCTAYLQVGVEAVWGSGDSLWQSHFHGRAINAPQHADLLPAPEFLAWHTKNVFNKPARQVVPAVATPRAAR